MTIKHRPPAGLVQGITRSWAWLALAVAAACGGGGGDGPPAPQPQGPSNAPGAPGTNGGWSPGLFLPSASFAGQCAAPRPGTGDLQGSVLTENNWLRSWSNELYLWYDEIEDRNPALYSTPQYFDLLKTFQLVNGKPKDRFHFMLPTEEWERFTQSGSDTSYGVQWVIVRNDPPRRVVAGYTQPQSPAANAGIERGAEVLEVDGVDLATAITPAEVDALNRGLFPAAPGETHRLLIRDRDAQAPREVELTSAVVTTVPVQDVKTVTTATGERVGYLHFTDHIAIAERLLVEAVTTLHDEGVTDLVLDLRYNGGGLLAIASELAFMIAGPGPTAGRAFELSRFNDKHTATNPVTGLPLAPTPFFDRAIGFSAVPGAPLPTLNLSRVYVITGATTCSASESIINGLRGVGVEVIQIGGTTCGKPYGYYPRDNCGTTYFSIQLQAVNEQGFGDYQDGFSPQNTLGADGVLLPGCSVADDFSKALGDPEEARFAAALDHRASGTCPAPAAGVGPSGLFKPLDAASVVDGVAPKSPWLESRILVEP